jgi:hypothetical protein
VGGIVVFVAVVVVVGWVHNTTLPVILIPAVAHALMEWVILQFLLLFYQTISLLLSDDEISRSRK